MYFDWGILHSEQKYFLYNRDGSSAITNANGTDKDTESDKNDPDYSSLFAGTCPIEINATYYQYNLLLIFLQFYVLCLYSK